mmetsp:Transcript_28745/g.43414  ORF Transcript_28745/g.43414 Transcript_28745/m.43414 type:complete len:171 (+) Transcript_28745:1820-2332(+)
MIEKVRLIAQNPLIAASDELDKMGFFGFKAEHEGPSKEQQKYETVVLEKAIVKIGHLLALGLGEAGGMIIGQNMTHGGDLDPIIPGNKEHAIFGFCILDNFLETTEALQTDIMAYVNRIAEIVHSCVDRYGGSTNKNIGEAFLCVWKFFNADEIAAMAPNYNNRRIGKEN